MNALVEQVMIENGGYFMDGKSGLRWRVCWPDDMPSYRRKAFVHAMIERHNGMGRRIHPIALPIKNWRW